VKALRQLANRLLALARWRRLDAELDDEIRAHIEMASAFFRTVTERLAAVPGVDRASLADSAPLEGAGGELPFHGVTVAARQSTGPASCQKP
jgi:hypothetical protein